MVAVVCASQGAVPADAVRCAEPVELGRIGGAFGVKGWVRLQSFTEPPATILDYEGLRLVGPDGVERDLRIAEARQHGLDLVVRLEGIESRDAARALARAAIVIERGRLPGTAPGEYYWHDLIGLEAVNLQGQRLGRVEHFIDAPANPVMVVQGDREHWLPLVPKHLKSVDLMARRVVVDWDPVD